MALTRKLLHSDVLRALSVCCLLAFGLSPAATATEARVAQMPEDERPNVLVIVLDDQREGTLNVMPATRGLFLRKGTNYSEAYATSPLCCPSRASIMTGRYPHNHEVRRNEDSDNLVQESTIQYYLQQEGYLTGIAGKYLNSWKEAEVDPPYFDRWAVVDDSSYQNVYYDFVANINGRVAHPGGYSTDF